MFSFEKTLELLTNRVPDMSYFEVAAASLMFQSSLYIAIRLAHRGFTLGELSLVCFGATVLFMEMTQLTLARVRFGFLHLHPYGTYNPDVQFPISRFGP